MYKKHPKSPQHNCPYFFDYGGAPILHRTLPYGNFSWICPQEFLDFLDLPSDHIAIRTSYYSGIDSRKDEVQVFGLNYVIRKLKSEDSLLIVDDVYDTGMSVNKVVSDLESACKKNTPEIRIATPYFKPSKNKTERIPDYYIHETDQWLVFPHELQGLSMDEIRANKPELDSLIKNIESLKSK